MQSHIWQHLWQHKGVMQLTQQPHQVMATPAVCYAACMLQNVANLRSNSDAPSSGVLLVISFASHSCCVFCCVMRLTGQESVLVSVLQAVHEACLKPSPVTAMSSPLQVCEACCQSLRCWPNTPGRQVLRQEGQQHLYQSARCGTAATSTKLRGACMLVITCAFKCSHGQ